MTTIDSFYEQHFAENVVLLTSKTLVVRNLNNLLRVNLETGNVKPIRFPVTNIDKQRSPDSSWIAGVLNGQFYCDDVDADDAKTIPIGRTGISDFLWIGNDKCLGLAGRQAIVVYDRLAHTLKEGTALPFQCFKISEPSPDGRYIFAVGGIDGRNGTLVDMEKRTASRLAGGAGITWVSNDTFAYSRELPDSESRGTWLQTVGQGERRVSPEPYLVVNGRAQLLALPAEGIVILETRHGLIKMKPDGTNIVELVKLPDAPAHVMAIQDWKMEQ